MTDRKAPIGGPTAYVKVLASEEVIPGVCRSTRVFATSDTTESLIASHYLPQQSEINSRTNVSSRTPRASSLKICGSNPAQIPSGCFRPCRCRAEFLVLRPRLTQSDCPGYKRWIWQLRSHCHRFLRC